MPAIARGTFTDVAITAAWNAGELMFQDEALAEPVALVGLIASTPATEPQLG